jgi:hypothetical protein
MTVWASINNRDPILSFADAAASRLIPTNIVVFDDKADHSASAEKAGVLAHGQNRSIV